MKVKTTLKRLNQNIKLPNQTAERSREFVFLGDSNTISKIRARADYLTLNKLNNEEAELVQASN